MDEVDDMENMKKKQSILLIAATILLVAIIGFGWYSKHHKFSGVYVAENAPFPFPDQVYFVDEKQCYYDGYNATYLYKNGKITFYWFGSPDEYGCSINGKKMILTLEDEGMMVTYIKQ